MIISEKDAVARLESSGNLINRLRSSGYSRRDSMGLFGLRSGESKPEHKIEVPTFVNPFDKSDSQATALAPIPFKSSPPSEPTENEPNLDNLLDNANSRIKLGFAHDEALDTLVDAVKTMRIKLEEIRPDKLPSVIAATSKVVDQIQRQRIDANKNRDNRETHYHFYVPERKKVEEYEVIDVG